MSRRRARGRARFALVVFVAVVAIAVGAPAGSGQTAPGTVGPLPALGAADSGMTLMGAARDAGEVWGYRELPLTIGEVRVGTRELEFGPPVDPADPEPQLAFVRYTDGAGWQVFETPRDEAGNPYRGPVPNRLSARITPDGGGVLVGRDTSRPPDDQVVVIHHPPGGAWRQLPAPSPDVLLPGEALAEGRGAGAIGVAAVDEGGGTGLFFAPAGDDVDEAIIHYDGANWRREAVDVPNASDGHLEVLALDATDPDNAWALVQLDPTLGRSVTLFQRTAGPDGPLWVDRGLAGTPFADTTSPPNGIAAVEAAGGAAQPLTVTSAGAWVDLRATIGGVARSVTLYFDFGAQEVTGSWCDASACGAPLGVQLSQQGGYRSFAWAGGLYGSRVITNPLDPGGVEETNRGTYLKLSGTQFARMPGGGGNFRASGAFTSPDSGWLEGPVQVSTAAQPPPFPAWPVSLRAPLADVTPAPGQPRGALGSEALAVGVDGSVLRYKPSRGWIREFLFSSSGAVNRSTLRAVAWPEPLRAYAVGDLGAMWQWNAEDGLWSPDPGVPIGFEGNLMDVAFDPADPSRGYAVGRNGVLLSYGKGWEQQALPPGFGSTDFTSIAFAGRQAIVAARGNLLVNDGGGWQVDESARALLDAVRAGSPQLFAVAGLPDGGAVAAGRDIVMVRDAPNSPWRFTNQPLPGSTVVAAAATRPGGGGSPVRAIVSVAPQLTYPPADDLPDPEPGVPPPILPPFALPGDGYVLRETESGWEDQQRTAFAGSGLDRPLKSDPILSFLLDDQGNGWAVGGWGGHADAAGRGSSATNSAGRAIRTRVRTAAVMRYGAGAGVAPTATGSAPVSTPPGPIRLAVAGHAQCEIACADLAPQDLGPDRTLTATLAAVAAVNPTDGPRALLYTGNRVKTGLDSANAARYASLLGGSSVPVFPALGSNDASNGVGVGAFQSAFAGFPAPLGGGAPPAGVTTDGIPGAPAGSGARTHYAFDSHGPGGEVRVVVIDNSLGSLAASDPHQNPAEPQMPWLQAVLADARAENVPVIVMGNRSLNTAFTPKLNVASDGNEVARLLVDGGASAYVFDRPEENRILNIPAGASSTIPSFGTGTLGYRSPVSGVVGLEAPDALFGDTGFLVLELDRAAYDPSTNRAPVSGRLIPVVTDLSLEATDGTLVRRSRPALFRGLGRRPVAGDRWGRTSAGSGNPDPAGGDPYTPFPPEQCLVAGCSARIVPEYEFTSSDPDIADFVKQDPASTNLRKPFLDENDKVVTDHRSGLLCAFNAGETTVMVSAGGLSYSERVTVLDGSVQRPCGTRPLDPSRFPPRNPSSAPPPPPAPAPSNSPTPTAAPPPPPAAPSPPPANVPASAPVPAPTPAPAPTPVFLPPPAAITNARVPAIVPLPPPPAVRPIPPGGAPARVYQVEEKREEEAAVEESQAFSRFEPANGSQSVPPYLLALVLVAALTGASVRGRPGRRGLRARAAPAMQTSGWTDRRHR